MQPPFILEALPFHHMTPMAGGIPDTDDDRFIFLSGPGKRILSPWQPIDRVMGMLQQVRAALLNECIGKSMLHDVYSGK